jgi:hypothetical protein
MRLDDGQIVSWSNLILSTLQNMSTTILPLMCLLHAMCVKQRGIIVDHGSTKILYIHPPYPLSYCSFTHVQTSWDWRTSQSNAVEWKEKRIVIVLEQVTEVGGDYP